jgi:DNA-directed RNA polymerase specialized sigma24 family protein
MTRRRFITGAEAAEVLDISVEAVGGRIKRATLASPDL